MKRLLACVLVGLSLVSMMSFGWRGRGGRGGRWGGRGWGRGWHGPRVGFGYRRPWVGSPFWGPRYRSFNHYCKFHPNDQRCIDYYYR